MRCGKVWKELKEGREWIVDADLKDFFGSVDHEKLMTLVNQTDIGRSGAATDREHAQGRMLCATGSCFPTEQGTPQGGVISPLLSNILLDSV